MVFKQRGIMIIDKHTSETLQFSQIETEFELQSGPGLDGERQKAMVMSFGRRRISDNSIGEGKSISEDHYLNYKTLGTILEIVHPKEPNGQLSLLRIVMDQQIQRYKTQPGENFIPTLSKLGIINERVVISR